MTTQRQSALPKNARAPFQPAFEPSQNPAGSGAWRVRSARWLRLARRARPSRSTEEPRGREVRIEHQCPVKKGDAVNEAPAEMRERMTASRKGDRVAPAKADGSTRQSSAVGYLPRAIGHPTVNFAPENAPSRHSIRRSELLIERERPVEQRQSRRQPLESPDESSPFLSDSSRKHRGFQSACVSRAQSPRAPAAARSRRLSVI